MKAYERGLQNQGIDNLLNFWSTKIRDNLPNFFADQKLLILLDEIDQKTTKIESKKESIEKEKQKEREKQIQIKPSKINARGSYQYKPMIIKGRESNANRNIKINYKIDEKKNNKYVRKENGEKQTKNIDNKKNNDIINNKKNEQKNNRYIRKNENEKKELKPSDINKNTINNYTRNEGKKNTNIKRIIENEKKPNQIKKTPEIKNNINNYKLNEGKKKYTKRNIENEEKQNIIKKYSEIKNNINKYKSNEGKKIYTKRNIANEEKQNIIKKYSEIKNDINKYKPNEGKKIYTKRNIANEEKPKIKNNNDLITYNLNKGKTNGDEKNNDNEENQIKSPSIDLIDKNNNKSPINNLENNIFNYQEEKLGENILEISKKDQNIISYIDIDLFLQRIAQEKNIYDNSNDEDTALNGVCIQHPIFIKTYTFVSKIITCFNYFYTRYINQDSEKNTNNNKKYNEKENSSNNKRNSMGYRNIGKANSGGSKNIQKEFDSEIFEKTLKKIPFKLIDFLILFIDLNEKFSKEILNKEIIEKIQSFYRNLLDIYEVKNKYKNDIDYSNKVLNGIKNRAILRRVKTQGKKLENSLIFSTINLLEFKIRDPDTPLSFFSVLDFDSKDMAAELTRISYHIFSEIQPKEFFKGAFTKNKKNETSPHLTEISNRFNKLSYWLMEEVLSYDNSTDRAQVLEKFIDIANELMKLNNFNDCMSIITGLGHINIKDLVKTWKNVSKQSNKDLENLNNILNFQDNYKIIREKIEECLIDNKPYIPFLGPYNKRICYLEEYGPYVKDDSLINIDKIVLVQQIFDQIYKFKLKKYDFVRNPKKELIIFQCLDPITEEELDKLASSIEPNFVLNNKKSHQKRVTNTELNFKKNYEKNENII